jgi:hypothetical protein
MWTGFFLLILGCTEPHVWVVGSLYPYSVKCRVQISVQNRPSWLQFLRPSKKVLGIALNWSTATSFEIFLDLPSTNHSVVWLCIICNWKNLWINLWDSFTFTCVGQCQCSVDLVFWFLKTVWRKVLLERIRRSYFLYSKCFPFGLYQFMCCDTPLWSASSMMWRSCGYHIQFIHSLHVFSYFSVTL